MLNIHQKDWCWSWSSNTLATWFQEPTHWKRPWCWERLKAKGEGGNRGLDGQIASPTQWTWIWANSGRQWRPGMLQSMGSQRVRHSDCTTTKSFSYHANNCNRTSRHEDRMISYVIPISHYVCTVSVWSPEFICKVTLYECICLKS